MLANALAILAIVISFLELTPLELPQLGPILIAVALALAAMILKARLSLVYLAIGAAFIAFFVAPGGFLGVMEMIVGEEFNARRFMRSWSTAVTMSVAFTLIALVFAAAWRQPRGPYRSMIRAARDFDEGLSLIGHVAAYLFIPLMLIIAYDITQRKILDFDTGFLDSPFAFSSTKLQELEWHIHAVLFTLALAFCYLRDQHVRIELVRDRMRPRTRAWIELLGCALALMPYCWLVVRFGWDFAAASYRIGEVSSAQTGLSHRWIIKAVLPIGFAMLGLAGLVVALRSFVFLFGPKDLRAQAASHVGVHHEGPAQEAAGAPGG